MFQRGDQDVNYSLISAVRDGRLKRARELINAYGLSYSKGWAEGYVLLCDAVKNNHAEVAKLLLTSGARVNRKNNKKPSNTSLHFAVSIGDIELVNMILDKGAIIDAKNEYGRTPLHNAIENKNMEVTELLLKHSADVNAGDDDGTTPLHVAAMKGCIEIVEALLQHGADINATDDYKRTALHYTALGERFFLSGYPNTYPYNNIKREIAIVEALLEYNVNVNAKQEDGTTALHIAAKNGHEEVVKVLLEYGADINCKDECCKTALHIASQEGHKEVVVTLLKYGADINITSRNNQTALDYVMSEISYDSEDDDSLGAFEVTVETLKRHIVKVHTANLYVSERNVRSIRSSKLSDFKDECEKEIASMKGVKINNLNTSFYDILAKGTSSLATYMRNENIVQVLKSHDYKTKFPIYASMIQCNFKKGMKRKVLLERGYKIFHFLFNNFPKLPSNCTEKIFSYLSDADLRILMDACKPLGICYPNANINDAM